VDFVDFVLGRCAPQAFDSLFTAPRYGRLPAHAATGFEVRSLEILGHATKYGQVTLPLLRFWGDSTVPSKGDLAGELQAILRYCTVSTWPPVPACNRYFVKDSVAVTYRPLPCMLVYSTSYRSSEALAIPYIDLVKLGIFLLFLSFFLSFFLSLFLSFSLSAQPKPTVARLRVTFPLVR
jgi:hypothetical protein